MEVKEEQRVVVEVGIEQIIVDIQIKMQYEKQKRKEKAIMEFQYENLEVGIRYFKNVLEEKENRIISQTNYLNNNRHAILTLENGEKIYLMFKKIPFIEWLRHYPQLYGLRNIIERVDSINIKLFRKNIFDNKEIKYIFIVYGDGRILKIDKKKWWERANEMFLFRKIEEEQYNRTKDYTGSIEKEDNTIMSCYFVSSDYWF